MVFKVFFKTFLKLVKLYYIHVYVIAVAVTFTISNIKFDLLDVYLYDLQTRLVSSANLKKRAAPLTVLLETTPETFKQFGRFPNIADHIVLLDKLKECKDCYIVYNLRVSKGEPVNLDGSYEDKANFARKVKDMNNVFLIIDDMSLVGNGPILSTKLNMPLHTINLYSAPKTIDTKLNSKSSVTRRIILDYQNQKLFHYFLSEKINPQIQNIDSIRGSFTKSGTNQTYIDFYPSKSFERVDFSTVYNSQKKIEDFNNKVIIIGDNTFSSIDDYSDSPYVIEGKDLITTSELHANMLQTLINNSAPIKPPSIVNFLVTFLVSIITIFVALSAKPSKGILSLLLTFVLVCTASILLLINWNIWLDLAHPLLTIFLCYYFFIPYRLIIENRRSWEYIQKNKLLQQVEELKTNFISMMSHDLKTPIARIQGMTEVILKDSVALSHTQREAVDTIKGSSDDLLKFINSILQYGRIESQGVHLHKQSKDINQLLQEVIKKHEFLAKVKKIKLITEFEPMFPIQIDVDLMKQVFSNLIENAIKYSHEDSSVIIKSREEGSMVIVEITDNGMGIPAEDLPNIFMKFYRSQNVKTSTIKGTGLGLYLAQYFTHLHSGEITVTSEPEKGSTFKVSLPS